MSDFISIFGNAVCSDSDVRDFDLAVQMEKSIFDKKLGNVLEQRNKLLCDMVLLNDMHERICELRKLPRFGEDVNELADLLLQAKKITNEWSEMSGLLTEKPTEDSTPPTEGIGDVSKLVGGVGVITLTHVK